jgi:hypothetical protein
VWVGALNYPKTPNVWSGSGIWINLKGKTGHCEGSRYYGKTKVGMFVPRAVWCSDWATQKGFKMNAGSTCDPCKKK